MRSYAVRLDDGSLGPEFPSETAAAHWAVQHLPAPVSGHAWLDLVLLRGGEEVTTWGMAVTWPDRPTESDS
jgi:hypothetical protein